MKYFVIFCALFATTFAQDAGKCTVKALDSFYMLSDIYGSQFTSNGSDHYLSFVGEIENAVLYLSDNPSGSTKYTNMTVLARNGLTGKSVIAGTLITFQQGGKLYFFQVVNGQKSNCSSVDSGPVSQLSKFLSSLLQIYPIPGKSPKPGEYNLCQGLVNEQTEGTIYDVVWNGSEMHGGLKVISALNRGSSTYSAITKFRPLTDADKHFFTNPCPQTAENQEIDQLMKLLHGALRLF